MKGSSRPVRTDVKANRGWARHLEGWQPGFLTIFVAGVSAWLAVPRPVPPTELPEPMIEPRELDRVARADDALADAAERERLDTDVRAVGSAVIAYNLAEVARDDDRVAVALNDIAEAVRRALPLGEEGLARLRAHHLRSFLLELHRWESTGVESDALHELGGRFVENARHDHWIEGGRLLADESVRGALFKMRWNKVTLAHGSFELTPIERRAFLRFLLLHPPREAIPVPSRLRPAPVPRPAGSSQADILRAGEQRAAFQADEYRLGKIPELGSLDPDYPAALARGVVLYRMRSYHNAVEAFRKHLDEHPDGPYAIRAQNYLQAALEAAGVVGGVDP